MNIYIDPELKEKCTDVALGCIRAEVKTQENSPLLWSHIQTQIDQQEQMHTPESIRLIGPVKSSKQAYRKLGKDPNRYRLSAEALLRRIVNGKGLYQINNVVDLLNLVSIQTGFSIGGYNAQKIQGPIYFGIGKHKEEYKGIGRGELNIENLPDFRDNLSAFGSPTSDSVRTQIDCNCNHFLMIIISFQGKTHLHQAMDMAHNLLEKYASGHNIEMEIVES